MHPRGLLLELQYQLLSIQNSSIRGPIHQYQQFQQSVLYRPQETLPPLIMATFHRSRPETLISRLTLRTKTDRLKSLSLYSHVMRTIRSSSTNSLSASTKHSWTSSKYSLTQESWVFTWRGQVMHVLQLKVHLHLKDLRHEGWQNSRVQICI